MLMGVYSIHGIERYTDGKINTQAGLYFENQGPMKIRTTQWDLVAYYDISSFYQKTKDVNTYLEAMNKLCNHLNTINMFQTNCETIYALIKLLAKVAEEKKRIIYDSIGHPRLTKRGIPFKAITKAAKILFGLCDQFCVLKSNLNVKKLADSNQTEINVLEQQLRVIKLNQDKGELVVINLQDAMKEIKNMTTELNIKSYV